MITISFLLLAVYTLAMCISNRGIPYSVSDTVYYTKNDWAFIGTMIAVGLLLFVPIRELAGLFLAIPLSVGFILVGCSPQFKSSTQGIIHPIGALSLLISSQLIVAIHSPLWLLAWMAYWIVAVWRTWYAWRGGLSLWKAYRTTKPLFWVEVVAVLTLYITLWTAS